MGREPQGSRPCARIVLAGTLSLVAWALLQWVAPPARIPWSEAMRSAAGEMARGMEVTAEYCLQTGIEVDPSLDPNGTCLVGPRDSPLFTTLGSLEAKRTSLSPDLAGLLAHLLREAGVSSGDTVGVGASGSFPGLLLAVLAAIEALEAHPVTILSLGASSYGATRPDFHLLDIHGVLERAGIASAPPAALSWGGEGDVGLDLPVALAEEIRGAAAEAGVPFLEEADLRANVARRVEVYGIPGAFVNVGGAEANLGTSPVILEIPPGLIRPSAPFLPEPLPVPEQRGVLFEMLARGVPVIHLLHMRGVALRYGLPWDPVPGPLPGSAALQDREVKATLSFWLLTGAYLGILALLLWWRPSEPECR